MPRFVETKIGKETWAERGGVNGWVTHLEFDLIVEHVLRPGGPVNKNKPAHAEPEAANSDAEIWLELEAENTKADTIKLQEKMIADLRQQLEGSKATENHALRSAAEAHRAAAEAHQAAAVAHQQAAETFEQLADIPPGE